MPTREEILNAAHQKRVNGDGTAAINTKDFPEAYKSQALDAMSDYAKQRAVEFNEWARMRGWNYMVYEQVWTNETNFDILTTSELYDIFDKENPE